MAFSFNQIWAQELPKIEPGVSRELARWRAGHYGDVRYKLNLTLEKQSPTLKGSIEIALQNKGDQIILDWRKIRGKEQFASVSNVLVNDQPAKFEETNEHLVFKEGVKTGENVIKLDFTSPIATSGAAVTRYVDKEDGAEYIYSLFVPSDASTAFPCFDQPDLKARFSLEIDAPKDWDVIANDFKIISTTRIQTLDSSRIQVAEGYKRHSFFETKQPISTYVFTFAAGKFDRFTDLIECSKILDSNTEDKNKLFDSCVKFSTVYVRKSQGEKFKQHAAEVFRLNREAVKYLETYFDYKFPFPKYDLILIPEFPFGGMEHAGATFLREDRIIFPQEPTANDYITRGNLIFHEAAHQWFGDTVTMRWFDDLWLKEGFAEFMAYKTMEKVLPQYNAWKAFYERNKPLAYLTDSTKGTTAIYQEIPNLSAAKSAYGNIVYRKAPAFLRQAEYYFGEGNFMHAIRRFLKQNAFKNAQWQDLMDIFENPLNQSKKGWAETWIKGRGLPIVKIQNCHEIVMNRERPWFSQCLIYQKDSSNENKLWKMNIEALVVFSDGSKIKETVNIDYNIGDGLTGILNLGLRNDYNFIFLNNKDYGYGIFLLDERSRNYVLANIQNEKEDFLRSMMWGALWDSVREAELNPKDYVELAIKNIGKETDELTIQTILSRVATAMNYYIENGSELAPRLEKVLIERMTNAETLGQRVTFYRAFVALASTEESKQKLKDILNLKFEIPNLKLKTKDKFDIVTRLLILGDKDAPKLLDDLRKIESSDEAKRYAYAAGAGFGTKEMKQSYFDDFLKNKEISESWIESAVSSFNSVRHADLTLPYLEKALAELPNLKRTRKIFFVNGWLAAFVGGQKSEKALAIVNKFLADNPNLDRDLRLKILEVADGLERSVKIRTKFAAP